MGKHTNILLLVIGLLGFSLNAKEIVVGIEKITPPKISMLITPVVVPDLISAKFSFEYRIHEKISLIFPVEAKWMDYRRAIKMGAKIFKKRSDIPEVWYSDKAVARLDWNFNMMQFKASSGIGLKYRPFSQAMTNSFFIKSTLMAGFERLHDYQAAETKDGAVFTHTVSFGYDWVKRNGFVFGMEIGEDFTLHTNPINDIPIMVDGFAPFLQFSFGFVI